MHHVGRVPLELPAPLEQAGPQRQRPDVPLPAGDDLEGSVAALVELDRMHDGPGFAHQSTRRAQQLDDPGPGLRDGLPGDLPVGLGGGGDVGTLPPRLAPDHGLEAPVSSDDGSVGKSELAPPGHVGGVSERADHGDTRTLLGIGQTVGQHRHPHTEQRCRHLGAEQGLVPGVVGMGDQGHAGGQELGSRRLDLDVTSAVHPAETQPVVGAGDLLVLHLGLRHRRLEVDVPLGRCLGAVGVPFL